MHPILLLFPLLRSSPNLEKLKIEVILNIIFWMSSLCFWKSSCCCQLIFFITFIGEDSKLGARMGYKLWYPKWRVH
jgi:hypothetical protein